MPLLHKSRREILDAISSLPPLADLVATEDGRFKYELDLEVIVYGRNYQGKKVGPYVRLLTYDPGEVVIREGAWGGNTFYMVVKGQTEVYIKNSGGEDVKSLKFRPAGNSARCPSSRASPAAPRSGRRRDSRRRFWRFNGRRFAFCENFRPSARAWITSIFITAAEPLFRR